MTSLRKRYLKLLELRLQVAQAELKAFQQPAPVKQDEANITSRTKAGNDISGL